MDHIKIKKPAIFRKLDEDFWLTGVMDQHDIERAAAQGMATIINILPEDDELCVLSDHQAKEITENLGLNYRHMPIYGHQLSDENFAHAFATLISECTGPKIIYCRTGMRSAFLWGMINAADLGVEEVFDRTLDIGFDLAVITQELEQMAQKPSPLAKAA